MKSYVYDLPAGPGKRWLKSGPLSNVIGGWRVSGVLTLTGTPLTITGGSALNTPGSTQTANQVKPDVQILHGINIGNPWFDPTAFVTETRNGVFGNTGRNIMNGPGLFNLDASLFKIVKFAERFALEIRGEAFAVTNTPQFSNPGTNAANFNPDPSKNTFGVVTGAGGARGLQLGLKLNF